MTAKKLIEEQFTLQKRLDEIEEELDANYVTGALVKINEDYGVLITNDNTHLIIGKHGDVLEKSETLKDLVLKSESDFEVVDPNFLATAYTLIKSSQNSSN